MSYHAKSGSPSFRNGRVIAISKKICDIPEILNIPDIPDIPEIPTIPEIPIIIQIASIL